MHNTISYAVGLAGLAVAAVLAGTTTVTEVKRLEASDAAAGDEFGFSVHTDGDRVIVGALSADPVFTDAGAAYLFERNAGGPDNWGETATFTATEPAVGDAYGQGRIGGDIVVIGARFYDAAGTNSGAAFVYRQDPVDAQLWHEVTLLIGDDATAGDNCTASDIARGIVVLACVNHDGAGTDAGTTYLFGRDVGGADNWGQIKKITGSDTTTGDSFGGGVLGDDVLFVAARDADPQGIDSGALYIFEKDSGGPDQWGETRKIVPAEAEAGDRFGTRVAVKGDVLAVSARGDDDGGIDAGAVYLFRRDAGGANQWGRIDKLVPDDASDEDNFGRGLAFADEDTLVAGSPFHDGAGFSAGAMYVFRRDGCNPDNWIESARFTASNTNFGDWFGRVLAGSNGTIVAGAWRDNTPAGGDAGSAYVLTVNPLADSDADGVADDFDNCTLVGNTDQRDSDNDGFGNLCDADLDGDGMVTFGDLALFKAAFLTTDPDADLDGDGSVTFGDLALVKAGFLLPPGPAADPGCAAR